MSDERGPEMWRRLSTAGLDYYSTSPRPGLTLAFITRRGGVSAGPYRSLNVSFRVGDAADNVTENLRRVQTALRLPMLMTVRQTHSDTVVEVSNADAMMPETVDADALFTGRPGIALGVKVADCLPVFVWDRNLQGIGIAHCGWRGTAARLAEKLARHLSLRLGVPLPDLCYSLGPCVCEQCYQVGPDVRVAFNSFPDSAGLFCPVPGSRPAWLLSLRRANDHLLQTLGLTSLPGLNRCTMESSTDFFSVRSASPTGRNLALVIRR